MLINDSSCRDLFGFFIDDNSGPRRSSQQIAYRKGSKPFGFRESDDIATEILNTSHERETNYVHQGWLPATIKEISPWTAYRISRRDQVDRDIASVTKHIIRPRLRVALVLEDLEPAPEFEDDVRAALGKTIKLEKFQELRKVFARW